MEGGASGSYFRSLWLCWTARTPSLHYHHSHSLVIFDESRYLFFKLYQNGKIVWSFRTNGTTRGLPKDSCSAYSLTSTASNIKEYVMHQHLNCLMWTQELFLCLHRLRTWCCGSALSLSHGWKKCGSFPISSCQGLFSWNGWLCGRPGHIPFGHG